VTPTILIVYATKHGSTREVAATVADELAVQGFETELRPAADVDDLSAYEGVVLGTALYMGRLHRDARRFLKRHEPTLSTLPIAVFAMGPQTMERSQVRSSRQQLDRALAKTPKVRPVDTAIFGGVVEPSELHFPFNKMVQSDARDWDEIANWAHEVGVVLAMQEQLVVSS